MLSTDADILNQAEAWRRAGRGVAIATVVETWGSAPRPIGSHLVDRRMRAIFSAPYPAAASRARSSKRRRMSSPDGAPRMLEFGVADETAWRVGLSCGGRIKVYVEKLA